MLAVHTAVVLLVGVALQLADAKVDRVTPNWGSLNGGTRITIFGSDFSGDQFSFTDDPNVGNEVTLVSDSGHSVGCDIHRDGCTKDMIQCYTRKGMAADVAYRVKVKSDGVTDTELCSDNTNWCIVKSHYWYTPRIEQFSPWSGKPGEVLLTTYGRIITDLDSSARGESSNGQTVRHLRRNSPQNCELKNGTGANDYYQLEMDAVPEDSLRGWMICKPEGSFVGNANLTFMVQAPYGRSVSDKSQVSANGEIYMVQYYTDIQSISPAQGSTEGGTVLTITGDFYDDAGPQSTYKPAKVFVGGAECGNVQVTRNEGLTCVAPAEQSGSVFPGNRGVLVDYWASPSTITDNASAFSATETPTGTEHFDETMICSNAINVYWTRTIGIFEVPSDGTGQYQFSMLATNGGALYADGVSVATSTGSWAWSGYQNYVAGQQVELVAVASSGSDADACVHVRASYFNTKFTSVQTPNSIAEIQRVTTSSTVVVESQTLAFSGFTATTPVNEVQEVCVTGGTGNIRLGLYGVFGAPASFSASAVEDSINDLAFLEDESFSVTSDSNCLTITFNSNRGNIPDFETAHSDVTVSVTETTTGVSSQSAFSFQYGGVPSPLIPYDESDTTVFAGKMEDGLDSLFGVRCPSALDGSGASLFEGFEAGSSEFGDDVASDVPAFCGRFSIMNDRNLYPPPESSATNLNFNFNKYMCFAVKDLDNDRLYLKLKDTKNKDTYKAMWTTFTPIDLGEDGWRYTCVNLYEKFSDKFTTLTPTSFVLYQAKLQENADSDTDYYVDSIYFGSQTVVSTSGTDDLRLRRLQPGYTNPNEKYMMEDVTVAFDAVNSNYLVTMAPHDCGDNFDDLALDQAQSGASMAMTVGQVTDASGPVRGVIRLTYNGSESEDIDLQKDDGDIATIITGLDVRTVTVQSTDESTCANRDIDFKFGELPGDLPIMTITKEVLTSPSTAAVAIAERTNGYLLHDPITGSFLSTKHSVPQVEVFINDIPTMCRVNADNSCDYTWSASATPTVTNISPTTGNQNIVLTITGTGFGSTNNDNTVTIGGVACTVTSSSTTSVTCTLGNGPLESFPVDVDVDGKGYALNSASDFTYTADVTAISPTQATLGGNIELTVTGYGFSSGSTVSVDGTDCPVTSSNIPDTLYCTLPPASDLTVTSDQAVTVSVTVGSTVLSTTPAFTYKYYAAQITSVTPAETPNVRGNTTIDIVGTGLGTTGFVYLDGKKLDVNSRTDTAIQVVTPVPSPTGKDLKLIVMYGTEGAILDSNNALSTLDIIYKVTNVYPTLGSLYGGTKLTVTGEGFGTEIGDVSAYVGDIECAIDSLTDTQLVCDVGSTGRCFETDNMGTTGFGEYYAWSVGTLNIEQGDTVKWSWDYPEFINDVASGVYERESLTSTENLAGGISSGAPSKKGEFLYQFTTTGSFPISSDYIDTYQIKHYGMTVKVGPKEESIEAVSVLIVDTEPEYDIASGVADPVDSSGCTLLSSNIAGTTPESLTPKDDTRFNFQFCGCRTPTVTDVSFSDAISGAARSGTLDTVVTVTGTSFSTEDCANIAKIGDCECTVASSTATSFTCTPGVACQYDAGVYQPLSVNVNQYGNAGVDIKSVADKSVAFVPNVHSISPSVGSQKGGTTVTITASGITDLDSTSVTFNGISADCTSIGPLVCTSPKSSTGEVSVSVDGVASDCTGSCTFMYDTSVTPTITDVSPPTSNGSTLLTFTGTLFGSDPSLVSISVGGETCTPVTVSGGGTSATCTVQGLPGGSNSIELIVNGVGKASTAVTVDGTASVSLVSPDSGSVNGGTVLTFTGLGFAGDSTVTAAGVEICSEAEVVSLTELTCTTVANATGSVDLVIESSGETYSSIPFTYSDSVTPTVTSISPTSGAADETVTIAGSNFGTDASNIGVTIGDVECTGVALSGSDITCTTGQLSTGTYAVQVNVAGQGLSNDDVTWDSDITVSGISPTSGDSIGNQRLTVSGSGFTSSISVSVCDNDCAIESVTTSAVTCITPPKGDTTPCDVVLSDGTTDFTSPTQYAYADSVAPTITALSPSRGGTGGGTSVTITGTLLDGTSVSVSIDGVDCPIDTNTATQIECTTDAHVGSVQADVVVEVDGDRTNRWSYYYVDAWSSTATWGGGPVPAKGEMIVIPEGQVVLLDQDTEVLGMVLIQGSQLIFDDTRDVTLKAERILITDGGGLQIGTEDDPYTHQGVVELHGHTRSKELPIYGNKMIGVRNGTLDLFGQPIMNPWTQLAATAQPGHSKISVQDDVSDWVVGGELVIATTGDKFSSNENEKHKIAAITANNGNWDIDLEDSLEFKHLGTEENFSGVGDVDVLFEYRAEVGLLSRNVQVRGNEDAQWETEIEQCEAGFNPGEFVTQTCFQGRFGEETGSSEYGAQILIHATEKDTQVAQAHISYAEVTFAGQAFRLGRYPIHFHLNGDMSESYVKGSAIHHTFNRAINIHGSHNILIERNVVYDVMGGALFLEDGIEVNNTYDGNLVVFVKASSSLLNDDVTPASFWVTNAYNTYVNNIAAGGTHFGWWYRMHEHPDGPSYDENYCPRRVPLQKFKNNQAHSFGWFGIWVFQDYYPQTGGACSGDTGAVPAVFEDFIAWNNEKGVEFVNHGALQIQGGKFVQNALAGWEGKLLVNAPRRDNMLSAMINDTLFVGKSTLAEVQNDFGTTAAGIVMPYGETFQVHNSKFLNFESTTNDPSVGIKWTSIDGTCSDQCGGYIYQMSLLAFDNVDHRLLYRWGHEAIVEDIDGSLCGTPNTNVLPNWGTSFPSSCGACDYAHDPNGLAPIVCPGTERFHRLSFNNVSPSSVEGKQLRITNSHGQTTGEFRFKRLTHKPGWMAVLMDGEINRLEFVNAENMTNVSFTGVLNELRPGDCVILQHKVTQLPDVVSIDSGLTSMEISDEFTCDTPDLISGNWSFDSDGYVNIALIGASGTGRRKRGGPSASSFSNDLVLNLQIQKCFFAGCIPPPDPEVTPPPTSRPNPFSYWNDNIWTHNGTTSEASTSGTDGPPGPTSGNDILINSDIWVVIRDETTLELGTVEVEGGLEIDYETTNDYKVTVNHLIINGGRFFAGWQNNPLQGTANIVLAGNQNSADYTKLDGYPISSKSIGVFGSFETHGADTGPSWLRLAGTASAGSTTLQVDGDTSKWNVNDEIVVTSSSRNPAEAEWRVITSNSGTGAIGVAALTYTHQAFIETVEGRDIWFGAVVGHLSRTIVIEGEYNAGEHFGGRMMASVTQVDGNGRTGYVRANFTRFKYMGQEGWTEDYDPRLALAYLATGDVREAKPSIVSGCAFTDLYSTAIGAYGIGGLTIENNVVVEPVGNGIRTTSDATNINGNLVINSLWTGSYDGRFEPGNIRYEGGVAAIGSQDLILTNNYVCGGQRFGYHIPGEDCDSGDIDYENNYAVGNMYGAGMMPHDDIKQADLQTCTRLSGFYVYKSNDYGLYYNNKFSVELDDNVLSDNTVSALYMVIEPGALGLECAEKFVDFTNNIVIGKATEADCRDESLPSGTYIDLSGNCRGLLGPGGENIGILFPQFNGGSNAAPDHPCGGIMSYNNICGKMNLRNTTFVNFGASEDRCPASVAITTSPANDDLMHPIYASGNTHINIDENSLIQIHRPNVGKINPADCVDMDCDGMKKALLTDEDGSLLGQPGSVIPESEYEWGGDPRRGLGDYRVPKVMLTDIDGSVSSVDEKAPNGKGIYRSNKCKKTSTSDYGLYVCKDTFYRMLVIQSIDGDTETRRLSPVAVLSDGFLDLINGPQDHGWCSGYTCQKRISMFHALVNPGQNVDIFLTGVNPDMMRYFMLHAEDTDCIVLGTYYTQPNRRDVFTDDGLNNIWPTNSENDNGLFKLLNEDGVDYMPTCDDPHGTNFLDRDTGMLYITMIGSNMIRVKKANVVVVSFGLPAMTEAEFFGKNIIQNLAEMLDIPLSMVRVVKIVSESSTGRKRRSTGTTVIIEVGETPQDTVNVQEDEVFDLAELIMNSCQEGTIESNLGESDVECDTIYIDDDIYTPAQPDVLQFHTVAEPEHEGVLFTAHPQIRAYDTSGNVIEDLGINESPWEITATLRAGTGHASAVLGGTLTTVSSKGWFNFTDLEISHAGSGYIIDFEISAPASATILNLTIETDPFDVAAVPMTAGVYAMTTADIEQNDIFSMTLDLRDSSTDEPIPDITWRGHTFDVTCGTFTDTGNLTGSVSQTFDSGTGRVQFDDLAYTSYGFIYLACRIISSPVEFDFYSFHKVVILSPHQASIVVEATNIISVRYKLDYYSTLTTEAAEAQMHQATLDLFIQKYPDIIITDSTIAEGSIVVTFTIQGTSLNITSVTTNICEDISNGQTITIGGNTYTLDAFMTVDGSNYYEICNSDDDDDKKTLHPGFIALIVILCLVVIGIVVFVLVWKFKIKPQSKTHGREFRVREFHYADNGRTVFLAGPNQKIQDIFYRQKVSSGLHAEQAAPITTLYDETPGYLNMRKSPLPVDLEASGSRNLTPLGD